MSPTSGATVSQGEVRRQTVKTWVLQKPRPCLAPRDTRTPPSPAFAPSPGPGKSPLHPGFSTHIVFMANGFGPDMEVNFFFVSLGDCILTRASVKVLTQKEDLPWRHFLPPQSFLFAKQQGLP